ncbi:MAG: carboxymuconolactone decarboxylase family protein [Rhodospirillaceae bacterium]|nr:carboxymuconolactone decarboxylase family protein [Rhodospirillaceae bacterium]
MTKPAPSAAAGQDALARLDAVKAKRGYLLPHHGLLAITAPELLAGYDACYTALTLVPRHLSPREREFVWLGVLNVRRESIASQHLTKFKAAGGTQEEVELIVRLSALAEGAGAFDFIAEHWQHHLTGYDRAAVYAEAFQRLIAGTTVRLPLVHMAAAAIHACLQRHLTLAWHIAECYRLKTDEYELSEALSYVMFSGSVPYYIEACGVWQQMIRRGDLAATPPFATWAAIDSGGPG